MSTKIRVVASVAMAKADAVVHAARLASLHSSRELGGLVSALLANEQLYVDAFLLSDLSLMHHAAVSIVRLVPASTECQLYELNGADKIEATMLQMRVLSELPVLVPTHYDHNAGNYEVMFTHDTPCDTFCKSFITASDLMLHEFFDMGILLASQPATSQLRSPAPHQAILMVHCKPV